MRITKSLDQLVVDAAENTTAARQSAHFYDLTLGEHTAEPQPYWFVFFRKYN